MLIGCVVAEALSAQMMSLTVALEICSAVRLSVVGDEVSSHISLIFSAARGGRIVAVFVATIESLLTV